MKIKEILSISFLLILIVLLGVDIYQQSRNKQAEPQEVIVEKPTEEPVGNKIAEVENTSGYVVLKDTIVNSVPLHIYKPHYDRVELACGPDIPDGAYHNEYFYCVAGAFTGVGYENGFSHDYIAGDHVSEGVRYNGYSCPRNTGAFVFYNGHYDFLYLYYSHELELASHANGMGFAQEMIVHNGGLVQTTRDDSNSNVFRVLCDIDSELYIVESIEAVSFGTFKKCLQALNVTDALYLDMGLWAYSWYRDAEGELHRPYPEYRGRLTNALVFVGRNTQL